jgi:hypothetical protein
MGVSRRRRFFLTGGDWLIGSAGVWQRWVGLGLATLLFAPLACDSGKHDADEPRQLVRADNGPEDGAFRNLGKRSAFDYGKVEPGEPFSGEPQARR